MFYRNQSGHDNVREKQWLFRTLTLKSIDTGYDHFNSIRWLSEECRGWIVRESEIVFEDVYNSPLWKAIHED